MTEQEIHAAVQREVQPLRTMLRRNGWMMLWSVATVVLTLALSIVMVNRQVRASERKFCAIVMAQDNARHATPPTTPSGQADAANWRALRVSLGCPPWPAAPDLSVEKK